MFLHLSVTLSTGGVCLKTCWDTHPPPGRHPAGGHPPGQTPHPCPAHAGIHTPPSQCMLGYTVPSACWDRHGYCCGWYASYWNASLFYYYYHLQLSCKGYVFTHVCHSVHGGGGAIPACIADDIPACLAAGGVCSLGGAWSWGGSAPGVGCLVSGGAFSGGSALGVPVPGGLLHVGGGGVWRPPPKADGYCCRRYASYWNAFLF